MKIVKKIYISAQCSIIFSFYSIENELSVNCKLYCLKFTGLLYQTTKKWSSEDTSTIQLSRKYNLTFIPKVKLWRYKHSSVFKKIPLDLCTKVLCIKVPKAINDWIMYVASQKTTFCGEKTEQRGNFSELVCNIWFLF